MKYAAAIAPYAVVSTGLTATAVSSSEIDLSWVDNCSDETSYTVQYTTDSAWGSYSSVTGIAANSQSYNKTGLSASTPYYFRVVTVEASENSTSSVVATATTASAASTDATISAGTLASQTISGTFTGGANVAASSALTVTVADASKTDAALSLTKGDSGSTINYVKSAQPADDAAYTGTYSAGSTTITVANNDIIWLLVTAADATTKLYYKITVTVTATDITTAGVTGFTAPATGGTPQVFGNLTAGSAQYTVTGLTWSPTDNPYLAATAYTATIVLASAATYKFPTGGIAVPTADGGGTVSAGTTSGGYISGNTLTFTVLFPATAAKTTPTLSVTNSPVTYNASPQAATVSGSVTGTVSNVEYAGSPTVPTNAGTYAITADFAPTDSVNYNSLTGASAGNFVINKASQSTLTFTGQTVTSPSTFTALSTTGGSGTGSVTYAVTTAGTAGCSIAGTTLSYTSVGTCGVTATKVADSNYNSTSSSEATFTINAATPTPTRGGGGYLYLPTFLSSLLTPVPTPTPAPQNTMTPEQRASLIAQIKQQLISLITQVIQLLTLQISQMAR